MSTELTFNFDAPVTFSVTDEKIAEIKKHCLRMTISGIDDRAGYAECEKSRKYIKGIRCDVQNRGKDIERQLAAKKREISGEVDRIAGELSAVETHLLQQTDRVDAEKQRIREEEEERKRAEQRKIDERFRGRIESLKAQNVVFDFDLELLRGMPEEKFALVLEEATKAERKRQLDAEVERLQRESERLRIAELEAERAAQAAELDKLRAELAKKEAPEPAVAKVEEEGKAAILAPSVSSSATIQTEQEGARALGKLLDSHGFKIQGKPPKGTSPLRPSRSGYYEAEFRSGRAERKGLIRVRKDMKTVELIDIVNLNDLTIQSLEWVSEFNDDHLPF